MAENRVLEGAPMHTTIIERSSGGGAAVMLAIALLLAVIVGGYFLVTSQQSEVAKDNAVAGAAQSVSDAADKVGAAVDQATGK